MMHSELAELACVSYLWKQMALTKAGGSLKSLPVVLEEKMIDG